MTRYAIALLGFAAAAVLSAASTRSGIAEAAGPGIATGWDVVLEVLANPYFMALPVLPAIVVAGAIAAPTTGAMEVLVRYGSRGRSALDSAVGQGLLMVPFLVVWVLAAVVAAAPLGLADGWSAWARSPGAESFAVGRVATSLAPLVAVAAQLLLVLTGAWAISVGIAVLGAWTGRGRLMLWSCAVFLVWAFVSFRVPWDVPAWAQPMSYLTVQHAVASTGTFWVPMVVSVLASVATLGLSKAAERRFVARLRTGPVVTFSAVALGLLAVVELVRSPFTAGPDNLTVVFYGLSKDRFDLVSAMLCLVLTVGPALVLQVGLTERLQRGLYEELIRTRSFAQWWWRAHLRRALLAAVLVPLGALCVHLLSMLVLHGTVMVDALAPGEVSHFVVFTVGQIFVSSLVLGATTLVTGRVASGLWALGVMVAASLPMVFRLVALPVGMSSLSLLHDGVPWWRPTLVLTIWGIGALAVVLALAHRRGINFE